MSDKLEKIDYSKLSFEDALAKLEDLVARMEEGNLPLDQMIVCFEQGNILTAFCRKKLEKLEKKIELLTSGEGQTIEWEEFDEGSARKEAALGSENAAPRRRKKSEENENSSFSPGEEPGAMQDNLF